jgi:integrase
VLYALSDGTQTSLTFGDQKSAEEFKVAVNTLGGGRALKAWGIEPAAKQAKKVATGPSVTEVVGQYIQGRSGVAKSTLYDYRAYLRNDITPALGDIPVALLTGVDVAKWVGAMAQAGSSGKTIANKHGLLSAALSGAVADRIIDFNPAAGTRLPRTEKPVMTLLTRSEFGQLRAGFLDRWHPLIDFMVASGARFGEIAGLRPSDVDRAQGTVHIGRAWKRTYEKDGASYELGAPKTARSVRTISVGASILEPLDYTREYLFTNTRGGPLKVVGWRTNVWYPSVKRAQDEHGLTKSPRIHDMRHTCASWLIQAGIPMPVVQDHLGHESINTTVGLYTHLDRSSSDIAAKAIAAMLVRD